MTLSEHIDLLVLGPVAAERDGQPLHLGGTLEHLVLASLVVGVGHVVADDALIEVLWGPDVPASAHNSLQSTVSRLRSDLHEEIDRVDHGYVLSVEPTCVDAVRFEQAVRAADAATTAEERWDLARQALGMWRGAPYGAFGDREPFSLERVRLDELRILASEHALAADIELGRPAIAASSLEALVQEHPYRERMWRLLIEAFVADSRRVDAVRACDQLEKVLGDVGLGLSREIADIRQAILEDRVTPPPTG